jgi:hypothetical protein
VFVHLCEAFLGIPPSISLFRYFFRLKPHPQSDNISPLGGCGIQFRQGKKNLFFDYDLVDFVKEWRSEWFYAGNMLPALSFQSDSSPLVNDRWEKNLLSSKELKKIQPLLDRIRILKQQGLNGLGIIASYLRRQIQPLKAREHYGFEYSGAEDPSRMVPALELTDEEVLERLKKILKGVSVIPHRVPEYRADNPPPAVSCFSSASTLFFIFSLLLVLSFSLLSCCCFIHRILVKILLTRSLLMTSLLGQKLWRTLLERLQSVSLKPPSSFGCFHCRDYLIR